MKRMKLSRCENRKIYKPSALPGGMESSRRKGLVPNQYVGACPCRQAASYFGGTCSNARSPESGFTLVELLVVMVILVLLAGIIGPRVVGYLGSSRTKAAAVEIKNLSTTLELYYLDVGDYPTTADGLESLVVVRGQKKGWNGPYLSKAQVPVDPWGNPYKYDSPGKKSRYDLYTFGRDGKLGGTGEDADTWN